jgi:rubrerythrin
LFILATTEKHKILPTILSRCQIFDFNRIQVEDIAKHFEHTADQELLHAWGHLELLIKKPDTKQCLEMAIEGETYEFQVMYPEFREIAEFEGNLPAAQEAQHQIEESQRHASEFQEILKKAEKRFAALARVEKRHAEAYQVKLDELTKGAL